MFIFIWMIFTKKGRYERKKRGQDYIAYMKKTGKWVPHLGKKGYQ